MSTQFTNLAGLGLLALLLGGASVGCSETPGGGDGGARYDGTVSGSCVSIDKSTDIDTAIELKMGEEHTGYVCPRGDSDYYKITVPAGDTLLRIKLTRAAAVSKVQLNYLLLKRQEKSAEGVAQRTVATAPDGDGKAYDALHCLNPGSPDLEPGVYYLLVQDNGNDAEDKTNPYKLTVTSEPDPDTGEPNESFDQAKPLSGTVSGRISCTEDADFFTVDVGADQLLEVKLTTDKATPVDIKYTIYDANKEWVGDQVNPDGTKGAVDLTTLHTVPKAGKYYVKVEDLDGNDGDPTTAYSLSATTRAEQDPNDKGTRNDSPATATKLTFAGGTLSKTFSGQIGSKNDVDYYVIEGLPAMDANNPGVIEVTFGYTETVTVDPSFAILYGAKNSPCSDDACCRVLDPDGPGCTNFLSCMRSTYNCIDKGDTFCANAGCSPAAGANCPTERRCAGAAVCLPGVNLCGAEQVVRWGEDGGAAKTAQLLIHPGPWYVRVSDLKSDEYEYGKNYTLTIKVRMDPDGSKELDNEYFPDLCQLTLLGAEADGFEYHFDIAKQKIAANSAKKINWGQSVTGYISYEGDVDFYEIPNPCPNEDCILELQYAAGPNCPSSGAPRRRCEDPSKNKDSLGLEFLYTLRRSNGKGWFGYQAKAGQSGCWGDCNGTCFYSYKSHGSSSYIFTVEDKNNNYWSWDCAYTFTLRKTKDGCVAPCVTHPVSGNCDTP